MSHAIRKGNGVDKKENWGHGILLKSSAAEHPDRDNIVGPLRDVAAATAGSGIR